MTTALSGRLSTTTTLPTASSLISSSRSTRIQSSSAAPVTRILSTNSASPSRTSATTRANAVLSTDASSSSFLADTTRRISDTASTYEVDAPSTRARGPSRVAIAVGTVLAILAVTGALATFLLFLKSRRRPSFTHKGVRPGSQRDPGPVEIQVERGVHDWSNPGYAAAMAKGVGTGGSADGHRPFRIPRKPPPTLSKADQVLSTPELVSEDQSEGIASSLTLPYTPRLQQPTEDINVLKSGYPIPNAFDASTKAPNGSGCATNPIPIPGVYQQPAESVSSGYSAGNRPIYPRMHSVDHVHPVKPTPTGSACNPTTSPTSSSACLHEPFASDPNSGLTISTPMPAPHFGSMPVSRLEMGAPARTISDVGMSQKVKFGFVANNLPLVYYPGSHEGPVSARGSIHSGTTHATSGDIVHRIRAQSPSKYPHPSLKKARSAEAMSASRRGYETPQSATSMRLRTPIRRPSRKEVPRRLIAELEKEIGGPSLDSSNAEERDNLTSDELWSSSLVPFRETKRRGPRPRSSSYSQSTTTMR